MTGKWHLGLERAASHPYNRGFDRSHGHLGPAVDYFTHIWNGGLDWQRNGEALREEGYSTELIVREAVSLIAGRDKSKPMFLYVAFNAPHTPLQATEKYLDRYAGIADVNRKHFAAMVSAVDDGVGAILDTLRAEGLDKDTIVVWVSDNGGNERAGADNGPFRGGKGKRVRRRNPRARNDLPARRSGRAQVHAADHGARLVPDAGGRGGRQAAKRQKF